MPGHIWGKGGVLASSEEVEKKLTAAPPLTQVPTDMSTAAKIDEIIAAFNAAETLLTQDDSVLCDIMDNADPIDYGSKSEDEEWTAEPLQKLFEEELAYMEKSKEYDENAADFLSSYDDVKHLPVNWENVCTVIKARIATRIEAILAAFKSNRVRHINEMHKPF